MWLRRFAPDKYDSTHQISDEAKTIRTGITELRDYLSVTSQAITQKKEADEDEDSEYESAIEYSKYQPVEEPDDEFVKQYEADQKQKLENFYNELLID